MERKKTDNIFFSELDPNPRKESTWRKKVFGYIESRKLNTLQKQVLRYGLSTLTCIDSRFIADCINIFQASVLVIILMYILTTQYLRPW